MSTARYRFSRAPAVPAAELPPVRDSRLVRYRTLGGWRTDARAATRSAGARTAETLDSAGLRLAGESLSRITDESSARSPAQPKLDPQSAVLYT